MVGITQSQLLLWVALRDALLQLIPLPSILGEILNNGDTYSAVTIKKLHGLTVLKKGKRKTLSFNTKAVTICHRTEAVRVCAV